MQTATDVINRIMWDDDFPTEMFKVGYLDRFKGIQEKLFTDFSWEDIASVDDYEVLAIPKHRIQYFKYKNIIVWDKTRRLDKVNYFIHFGQTIRQPFDYDQVSDKNIKLHIVTDIKEKFNRSTA